MNQQSQNDVEPGYVEDFPAPTLGELQQRDPVPQLLTVPVRHDGPLSTHELPSRVGTISVYALSTGDPITVLYRDLARKRAVLVSDAAMVIGRTTNKLGGAPWPLGAVLTLTHSDALYAWTATGTANLTVITENWAD